MHERDDTSPGVEPSANEGYEAPGIETVLTPEDLEREVLYGGNGTPVVCSL
jgi:hypothetical protein